MQSSRWALGVNRVSRNTRPSYPTSCEEVRLPERQEPYAAVVRSFVRAMREPNSSPSVTGNDGLSSLQVRWPRLTQHGLERE
jgi:hypothetical protein